jgi:large subunit ribosomal protein LP2
MRYVAAYLLAVLGGNEHPDSAALSKILTTAGVDVDQAKLDKLVAELKGKDLAQLVEEGRSKLGNVSMGGGSASPAAASSDAGAGSAAAAPEPVKEESESEEEEEMDGFDLF